MVFVERKCWPFICSKSPIETLKEGVKYVWSVKYAQICSKYISRCGEISSFSSVSIGALNNNIRLAIPVNQFW